MNSGIAASIVQVVVMGMRNESAFTSSFAILWRILQLQFQPNDSEACLRAFGALLNAG
jgi:hypothetical protein